ncbi:MAG: sigma-70 family RNA polymerase sigma factor [Bacteroidota bacterium]
MREASDQAVVNSLKKGNDASFRQFYLEERIPFIQWCQKNTPLSEDEIGDLYQEAQMHLYENIVGGRLSKLTSSLKTYLYSIAKNQLKTRFKKMVVIKKHEEQVHEHLTYLKEPEEVAPDQKKRINQLADGIAAMAQPCKSLLLLFYYENLRFKEIASRLGYKNESVAKNQKKRCLEKLKSLMK